MPPLFCFGQLDVWNPSDLDDVGRRDPADHRDDVVDQALQREEARDAR